MKKIIYFMSCSLVIGCSSPTLNCTLTKTELLKNNQNRLIGIKTSGGEVLEYRDRGRDSIISGYYIFYPNGHLKDYYFFDSKDTCAYSEEYSKEGKLLLTTRWPFVHNSVRMVTDDSIRLRLYFFAYNKNYKKIYVSTSDNRSFDLNLIDDTLYSNMKIADFGFGHLKNEQDIKASINVEYQDVCTKKSENFNDLISLHFKP